MESLELVFFLFFAVICSSFIIIFLTGFDFVGLNDFVANMFSPENQKPDLKEVDLYGFAEVSYDCWSSCGFGAEDKNCFSVFLKSDEYDSVSKETIESFFQKINLCSDCNILMENEIFLPRIVSVKCWNHALKIE